MSTLRGAARLAVEATTRVSDLVEEVQHTIARGPFGFPARLITSLTTAQIRIIARLTGRVLDAALSQLPDDAPGPELEALRAALNGVVGDHLHDTKNPLAIQMALHGEPGERLLVLVHGSSMNHVQWTRDGHDHGAALARDLAYSPVYVHYNTGLHVSTNGGELAERLEPIASRAREICLLGHSMGGLVARSACHAAEQRGLAWRRKLRSLVCLGTPHQGTPLERSGAIAHSLLGVTAYSAPFQQLARIRSAGVTDLRFGSVLDEHWQGQDRFALGTAPPTLPLPEGVACYAIAGESAPGGDGLVPVESALGQGTLHFADTWIAKGVSHLDLLASPAVYATLRGWLT